MKVVVHKHSDGISISHFSPDLLDVMTGTGYGWLQDRMKVLSDPISRRLLEVE